MCKIGNCVIISILYVTCAYVPIALWYYLFIRRRRQQQAFLERGEDDIRKNSRQQNAHTIDTRTHGECNNGTAGLLTAVCCRRSSTIPVRCDVVICL